MRNAYLSPTTPRNIKESEQLFALWPRFYRCENFTTGRPPPLPRQLIMIKAFKKYIYIHILFPKGKNWTQTIILVDISSPTLTHC